MAVSVDLLSFLFGLAAASVLWLIAARARPLWKEARGNLARSRQESKARRTSGVEADHRRATLRRAQGMHLAAALFPLDDILLEPQLLAPPPRVEPGSLIGIEDAVTLTVPYLPAWPELAAVYNAPTLTPAEALAGGVNLAFIGQPGTGKSVALAHVASLSANRSATLGPIADSVPFLLHVADLRLPISDVKELLGRLIEMTSDNASVLDLDRVKGFVQSCFRSGRALLLLDGFDELTSEGQNEVSAYISQVLHEYPKIRIVTTGAPEYLDGLLALGFAPVAVAAWNRQGQARFIRRWGESWSKSISPEWSDSDGRVRMDPLLVSPWLEVNNQNLTPLELTLKAWTAYAGDGLGPHILQTIGCHVRRLAPTSTPAAALETLAMEVMLTAQPIFDPRKARAWVKNFELPEEVDLEAGDSQPALSEPEARATEPQGQRGRKRHLTTPTPGLLGRLAATGLIMAFPQNKMRFVHPVFGAYLAGRALSGYKAGETLLDQPDWIGKLLTMRYFAAHGEVGSLVGTMLEWSRLPMHRPLLTAARWLRDAPQRVTWRGELLAALAELLRTEGLPLSLRGQALAALVTSGDAGVLPLFRQLRNTISSDLMHLAALGSGAVRDEKAVKGLEAMLQAPSMAVRRAACLALVAIGTSEALESVAHSLLNGDEDLRRAAAESLANDPVEGRAMLKDGAKMDDMLLRRATVYGLGRVDEAWASELLESMRVTDDQWVVRNSADDMLGPAKQGRDLRVPRPLKPPSQTPWLIALAAKQGMGISPGSPATELLTSALSSSNEEERVAALAYLKQNPSAGIIQQMYQAMFGPDAAVCEAAFLCLWEIGASGYKLPDPVQFGLG